jgi:hypothetical protein
VLPAALAAAAQLLPLLLLLLLGRPAVWLLPAVLQAQLIRLQAASPAAAQADALQ